MSSKLSEVLAALGIIKNADPAMVSALAADAALEKATDALKGEPLKPGEIVRDHWTMGESNASATKEEIKTGPPLAASGAGLEKELAHYSNPAPQRHGVAVTPEALDRMMGYMTSAMKAIMDSQIAVNNSVKAMSLTVATLAKAKKAKDEDEEDEEDEESETVEIHASKKASTFIAEAEKMIRKAARLTNSLDDLDDAEAVKAAKKQIKSLRKSASILLGKARFSAFAAGSVELKKSIRLIASKADINVTQEEEDEDDEEESDKAKKALEDKAAADAAAKATTDDKGNQADRVDPKNGNQAAAAKSDTPDVAALAEGLKVLSGTVAGILDVVAGKSKSNFAPIDITLLKAQGATMVSLATDKLAAMEAAGTISETDSMAAREIASKISAAAAGVIPASVATDRLDKSTPIVRSLFELPKAA